MKICYTPKKFTADHELVISRANEILREYDLQGYDLTLRQLYYQFVARGYLENTAQSYKRLGEIIGDARLAGRIDWDHITDRTRNARRNSHWEKPADIIESAAASFALDKWRDQRNYVEVWIEKDALVGVLEQACRPLDVTFFSCRGYTSLSELWAAAMRLQLEARKGKRIHVIHLGDHDPSGIDMSRDIEARLTLFLEHEQIGAPEVNRIALNMDQIRRYNPPPNFAKLTDSRISGYVRKFGSESWELDALEPTVLTALITDTVYELRDARLWAAAVKEEEAHRATLKTCAKRWPEVEQFLKRKAKN
jgi:hypothetical protein